MKMKLCLGLTVLMLVSAAAVDAFLGIQCCTRVTNTTIKKIDDCFDLTGVCKQKAFMMRNTRGPFCINPEADWVKNRIAEGSLECRPPLSPTIFEVLDEDDVK